MIPKAVEQFWEKFFNEQLPRVMSAEEEAEYYTDMLLTHPDSPVKHALDKMRWAETLILRRHGGIHQFCSATEASEFSQALAALEMSDA